MAFNFDYIMVISTALPEFVQIHSNGDKIHLDNNSFHEVRASHRIIRQFHYFCPYASYPGQEGDRIHKTTLNITEDEAPVEQRLNRRCDFCSVHILQYWAHTSRWRFLCRARWSEREKVRSQSGHWNGFTPVCFRKWRVSSSERANFHVQPSHMHL